MRFLGADLYAPGVDAVEVRRRIGMVFQRPNPFPRSIRDNVAFGPRSIGMKGDLDERIERALRQAALWDEVKDRLGRNAFRLSGGQQQRLCIARCLAVEPEVLLMDEPASALDPISSGHIEDLIHELKREYAIVIVTHNMQQAARVADRTAFFSVEPAADADANPARRADRDRRDAAHLHRARPTRAPRRTSPVASGETVTPQDLPSGYEGLRVGFTAAVSHELRTPLARLLSLLDTAKLPGVDVQELIEEACAEVVEMTQLVDDILFLSELEQGREVVALGFTEVAPYVAELYSESHERALRAELALESDVPPGLVVPRAAAHAARRARQPARQLPALRGARRDVPHPRRTRTATTSCSRSPTTAPASTPPTSRACSSASSAPTARERRAAPASVWQS